MTRRLPNPRDRLLHEMSTRNHRNLTLHVPSDPVSEMDAAWIALGEYQLEGNVQRLVGEKDDNFCLTTRAGEKYLMKVAHPHEDPQVMNLQTSVLEYLENFAPQLAVQRVVRSLDGMADVVVKSGTLKGRAVRVTTYLEGSLMRSVTPTAQLRRQVGVAAARLDVALKDFDHPAAHRPLLWDLQHAANLRPMMEELPNGDASEVLLKELDRFERQVAPRLASLRTQVVHNDLSIDNLLVSNDGCQLTGIIDFGDLVHTPLINDLAVAVSYQLADSFDPITSATEVIAGFHTITPLTATELELLPDLVIARVVMWITIPEWRAARMPENRDYVLRNTKRSWAQLRRLLDIPVDTFSARLRRACPTESDNA